MRPERRRKAAQLPKGAGGAKEARPCEPVRTGDTAWPAAAACCQRSRPAAPAGLGAAGTANEHREGWLEPMSSPDNVLRKHEGCDEESAQWRVQGALDQAGRQRAAASACATQGGLAGRTCPGEAFSRPFDVLLAVQDEVDLLPHCHVARASRCPTPLRNARLGPVHSPSTANFLLHI